MLLTVKECDEFIQMSCSDADKIRAAYVAGQQYERRLYNERTLEIVDACFHAFASSFRQDAKEMAEEMLNQ